MKNPLLYVLLLAGFAAGIVGLVLDGVYHFLWGYLPTPAMESIHLYPLAMVLIVSVSAIPPWKWPLPYAIGYLIFGAGLFLHHYHLPYGTATFLFLLWSLAWVHERERELSDPLVYIVSGAVLVLIGQTTTWYWYEYWYMKTLSAGDSRIFLLPGHFVALLGWLAGLAGSYAFLRHSAPKPVERNDLTGESAGSPQQAD